jgi:hypothetical protein
MCQEDIAQEVWENDFMLKISEKIYVFLTLNNFLMDDKTLLARWRRHSARYAHTDGPTRTISPPSRKKTLWCPSESGSVSKI